MVRYIGMPLRSVALVLILTACSGAAATTTQPPVVTIAATTSPASAAPSTSSAPSVSTTVMVIDEPDLLADNASVFVATLEEAFAGTSFEGAALDSPEVFIATAEVICVRLDNGDEIDQILVDYIEGLSNADGGGDTVSENLVSEDTAAAVAGGVLGASLELFCPEHRQLIED